MFNHFNKIILRSPLYSYSDIITKEGVTHDLDEVVKRKIKDPIFLESLYWSSPYLHQLTLTYLAGGLCEEKKASLLHTLKKYSIRACTRSTPYGIFAGCAVAEIGESNPKQEGMMPMRKVRIDMGLLQQIVHRIETDSKMWFHLHFKTNPFLYQLTDYYRFMESVTEDNQVQYQMSSLFCTELLRDIVRVCKDKPISLQDIFKVIGEDITNEDKISFVKELIDIQFLVSELQLGLTNGEELKGCKEVLERIEQEYPDQVEHYINLIDSIYTVLEQLKRSPLGQLPLNEFKNIESKLKEMGIDSIQGHLFHTDLLQQLPDQFTFPTELVSELNKAIYVLGKLCSSDSPHESNLSRFKKQFAEKYETQEIPMTEVLDAEHGIGFPPMDSIGNISNNALIDKLGVYSQRGTKQLLRREKNQVWLQEKMEAAGVSLFKEGIELTEEDLAIFDSQVPQLPNQLALMGTLLQNGKVIIQSIGGANANALLGRFAYLDSQIKSLCFEIAEKEAQLEHNCILAEILYKPEGRVANIARRPALAEYEIPVLASSSLEEKQQLPVQDLMVSVMNGQIVLRSKKLNKRVIPRLSNAHNYMNSEDAHYKFLASLQHQGKVGLQINWWAHTMRFLPRISYSQIILQRACWIITHQDIQAVLKSEDPLEALICYFDKRQMPQFVCLSAGDNELLIDTTSRAYLLLFLGEIRKQREVRLLEWLQDDSLKEDGRVQQFILPLQKKEYKRQRSLIPLSQNQHIKRVFEPGSEWLYFKLYCGAHLSDSLLKEVVEPAIRQLSEKGVIDKAFFIRYTDLHYHIRFRLHLSPEVLDQKNSEALACVNGLLKSFVANRSVWKVQLDTYQREIERYGQEMIMVSEEAFFQDSLLVLDFLGEENFSENEHTRFFAALKNIDNWLTLFNLSLEDRISFCEDMASAFATEFDLKLKSRIDQQYRHMKDDVLAFFKSSDYETMFSKRSLALEKLVLNKNNLANYIHMSINRWFRTEQRVMEYMAYVFCVKYYKQLNYSKIT